MYKEIAKKLKEEEAGAETPDFAKAIKWLRQREELSLEKLSDLTEINKQTLHSIENSSIKNPSFANLEKIAAAFTMPVNDLILLARSEYQGNLFKTTAAQRHTVSFETEKGFSIYSFSPPSSSRRDFFVGMMNLAGGKKLKYWQFTPHAKACIQPWDGSILFIYHGMNWRKEAKVVANETLYFDASIPHSFENLSENTNRILLVTYPSIF